MVENQKTKASGLHIPLYRRYWQTTTRFSYLKDFDIETTNRKSTIKFTNKEKQLVRGNKRKNKSLPQLVGRLKIFLLMSHQSC